MFCCQVLLAHFFLFRKIIAEHSPMYLSYIGFSILPYLHPILRISAMDVSIFMICELYI